ncbi:transcriptional regulator [Defluviimonas sp. 20V17]|nr:NepR family anti-sigma factor [Allgaiera indica]KDB05601.1 transcriptional regulator [Defluviimonas sp. 20V17]SDX41235.1 hypothetical protein SAMN05444006_11579 [Allgaiera indica]
MGKSTVAESTRANLRRQIDENLRRAYQEELEREVPDKFHELLEKLRGKESAK